jgi:outer membrane lipoprotein-sorting protein
MTRRSLIFVALFLPFFGLSQVDTKAKAILDKVSADMNALKSMTIAFSMTITTADEGEPIKQSGTAYLKGDKYKLVLPDQDIYCDGTTKTTHLKEEHEAYQSLVAEASDEEMEPNEMLTIWETGHKYKYDEETTHNDRPAHRIFLYPNDPAKKKYHTIIVKVDVATNEVVTVFIKGKDGSNVMYTLTKLTRNPELADSMFVFDCAKHPEVECMEE